MSSSFFFNDVYPYLSGTVKIVGSIAFAVGVLLYVKQDSLLYFPAPPGFPVKPSENAKFFRSPSEWNTKGKPIRSKDASNVIPFEETFLQTPDGVSIHTWLLLQKDSANRPTLIYFHGNAGNMGFRLQNAAEMYGYVGINVLMMDYRGFGSSTGNPNEKGLNIDAETVLEYAINHPK